MNTALAALQELLGWIQAQNKFHSYLNQVQIVLSYPFLNKTGWGFLLHLSQKQRLSPSLVTGQTSRKPNFMLVREEII